jgi:hypothetical protein
MLEAVYLPVYTSAPPVHPPSEGKQHYLPEDSYILGMYSGSLSSIARNIGKCIAKWANAYHAIASSTAREVRSGMLPSIPEQRDALIDSVFDWLEGEGSLETAGFVLTYDDEVLLDQWTRIPGSITISGQQFSELKEMLKRRRLPEDLYYPAEDQYVVVEPVSFDGVVIMIEQRYSPHQWQHREPTSGPFIVGLSERERREWFHRESSQFAKDIFLRMKQLEEKGRDRDEEEMKELARLMIIVSNLSSKYQALP